VSDSHRTTEEPTMTRTEAPKAGNPCWVDVTSTDITATRAFYTELFGWGAEEPDPEFGGYFNFTKDGERIAGAMAAMDPSMPSVWSIYLAVDDADAAAAAVEAAGGTVMVPPMDVGDLGNMAVYVDPSGAVIGTWRPGTHTGFAFVAEPGAPSWFELHTKAYEDALEFYQTAFGWDTHTMSDVPEFRYTNLGEGENEAAGVMDAANFLPPEVPSHWAVYFAVDDAEATIARAVELGATVVQPAEATPYGVLATLADPTGAMFRLQQPS